MGKAHKLTPLAVSKLSKPGVYSDGAGLYLRVTDGGSKHWIFRFTLAGRAHWMGLGPYPEVTVDEARKEALEARREKRTGINPITQRKAKARRENDSKSFQECANEYIASHRSGWKDQKHSVKWTNSVAIYCGPVIGKLPVKGRRWAGHEGPRSYLGNKSRDSQPVTCSD